MPGIDRRTGRPLSNYEHALQSIVVILSTRIGSRVLRRHFGGGVAELLGRAVNPTMLALFQQVVATAIDIWEPRFRVRRISVGGSVEQLRAGTASLLIEADFLPRGHLGDPTVERAVNLPLYLRAGGVSLE